uniref:Ubiquitin-like domain-containing protein n=1 Tax=Salix viminalis TaxID=40686 RepID=A0A6N2MP04_SALVM
MVKIPPCFIPNSTADTFLVFALCPVRRNSIDLSLTRRLEVASRELKEIPDMETVFRSFIPPSLSSEKADDDNSEDAFSQASRIGNSVYGVPALLNVRLRVLCGVLRYRISVNSQATFGEVKKVMMGEIRLQIGEQKIIYKGRERGNKEYLDKYGVRDRSKLILMEDPTSIEKRYIEMRKNARIEAAYRVISCMSMEIDKLAE